MKIKHNKILLLTLCFAFVFNACQKEDKMDSPQPDNTDLYSEKGTNPDETVIANANERTFLNGYVFTQTNTAGANHVLKYKIDASTGNLTLEGTYPTGGDGAGAPLGSQGSVIVNRSQDFLLVTNAGDNSISCFKIHNAGNLSLTSNISSGGTMPVSIAIYGRTVYVVNAGSDNIVGFELMPGGILMHKAGSTRSLSGTGVGAAQISFSPNGDYLYVTEKMTNKIGVFEVITGIAQPGSFVNSVGVTPFGFSIARERYLVVSNASGGAPNASTVTSYDNVNTGNITAVNGAVPNNQSAACWVALTQHHRWAFITNTGSNTISTYYVAPWGSLYLVRPVAANGAAPIDICVAVNNYYVYSINSGSQSIGQYKRGFLGDLINNGQTNGLPPFAAGMAVI
jgi:6-phosphogluconolactonase